MTIVKTLGLALAWPSLAAGVAAPTLAPKGAAVAPAVQVIAVQILSGGPEAGERRLELSDLAWDAARRQLLAVSDRGHLYTYAWSDEGAGPLAVRPLHRQTLPGRPNLEAMALDPDGRLHLIEELSGRVVQMIRAGPATWRLVESAEVGKHWPSLTHATPPGPVARSGHGIEAAMWLPGEGLAWASQHPVDGVHRVMAATGRTWTLRPTGSGATLKALARLDADRWLALEKVRRPGPDGYVLRSWAASCTGEAPCPTQDLPVVDPLIEARDNFEGLTCLGDGRCLLVTDDGGSASERTLLVLVRIPGPGARGVLPTVPPVPPVPPTTAPGQR